MAPKSMAVAAPQSRNKQNTTVKTKEPVKSVEKKEEVKKTPTVKENAKKTVVESEQKMEHPVKPSAKKTESKKESNPEPVYTPFPEGSLEKSVRLKLEALYSLQVIDTQIDKIRIIRGELPLEVQDLEDEIAGMNTRLDNYNAEIAAIDKSKVEYTEEIARSKEMIKKYEQQQKNVRNNREFESLAKEIEFQDLEVQLRNKKIKEADVAREAKQKLIDELRKALDAKEANLKEKMNELSEIIAETEKEEELLLKKSEKAKAIIEERYLNAYNRIRKSVRNGLAVVKIERHSCGGCFSKIPPQRQMEIRMHKKVLVCEYCGRIIVDESISDAVDK
ncbi:MAG: C4-type zinc ribbon domain-containing protein [Bacteroidales bacterium]|nr:C4-type zinc ribbon domain-containing protein [Bacteroidales bacterium]